MVLLILFAFEEMVVWFFRPGCLLVDGRVLANFHLGFFDRFILFSRFLVGSCILRTH